MWNLLCFWWDSFLRSQVFDWSRSFDEGWTEVENMQRLHFRQWKLWPAFFGTLKVPDSLISWQQWIISAAYLELRKDWVKLAFHPKQWDWSCLLHDSACLHIIAVTVRTLEEMHWEVLPCPSYSPDLALSGFHLFSPLTEALGWMRNHKLFLRGT
jgi:hypothetical protein